MSDLFFSTGQASRELGISPSQIRALCATGGIEAQSSPGGHYRIPKPELERLQRDGLPEVPRPLPSQNPRSAANPRYGSAALLATPSDAVVTAAESVAITEARLQQRKLEWELLTTEDQFSQREQVEADQEAERAYLETARLTRDQANQERVTWFRRWQKYSLDAMPYGADPQDELDLDLAVRGRLATLTPIPDEGVTRTLIDAEVQKVLRLRQQRTETQEAIDRAIRSLPYDVLYQSAYTGSKLLAVELATQALAKMPTADRRAKEAAAVHAVQPILAEYQHYQECRAVVSELGRHLPDATTAEQQLAREALTLSLAALPVGASRRVMEQVRDKVLAPTQGVIAERQAQGQGEQQRRQAEVQAAEGRKWAMVLASQERADHARNKRAILIDLFTVLPLDMAGALTPQARAAVSDALDQLPLGATLDEMTRVRDQALRPFFESHERRQRKEAVIAGALLEIHPHLVKLERHWDYPGSTAESLAEEFQKPIRKSLESQLTGAESAEQVARLLHRLVRRQFSAAPEPAAA